MFYTRIKKWADSRGISQQEVSINDWFRVEMELKLTYETLTKLNVQGYVLHKIEELIEYCEAQKNCNENEVIDAIADSMIFDSTELIKSGYDIEKTLNEVLLVIESRTGAWDNNIHKFVKDKSPEAKARWYKPDYVGRCKAKEPQPSLFQGGYCKWCEAYYNSLIELAEHEENCIRNMYV